MNDPTPSPVTTPTITALFGVTLAKTNLDSLFAAAEREGWERFADSCFSHVLARHDSVLKVFADPAYRHYVEHVTGATNPAYPHLIDDALWGDGLDAVTLERLEPLTDEADIDLIYHVGDTVREIENRIRCDTSTAPANDASWILGSRNAALVAFAQRFGQDALVALRDIVVLARRHQYATDLAPKNVLLRPGSGQLVFVDPIVAYWAPQLVRVSDRRQPPGHHPLS